MSARTPVLALVLLVCAPAQATVLRDWSLEERIANADSVVVGTVTAQKAVMLDGNIVTESTIAVSRTLYGPLRSQLVLSQLGGTMGEETLQIAGSPRFSVGDEVVLIVKELNGRTRLVGMGLGAFVLRGQLARQVIDVPVMGRDGVLRQPPGERVLDLSLIRDAAADVRRTLERTTR